MCVDCPTKRDRVKVVTHALLAETSLLLVMAITIGIVAVAAIQARIV